MSDRIDTLLEKLGNNRVSMEDMIKDVQSFRKKIEDILPKKIDFRNKFIWEEKMKTVSGVLATELSIRRQIDDSIRNEINIRTRRDIDDDESRDFYEALSKKLEDGTIKFEDNISVDSEAEKE